MGKLFVIEGIDGSGKATQSALLQQAFGQQGVQSRQISFPNYESDSSALVKMYLAGTFGSHPQDVNPYAASTFYAVDRYAGYKTDWGPFYDQGGVLVADRYTTSNAVHQCAKLPQSRWDEYLTWLFDFEYQKIGIPQPDCVLYLAVEPVVSGWLMSGRYGGQEEKKDIHERDIAYLEQCHAAAEYCARKLGWHRIDCMRGTGLRSVEDIAQQVWAAVQQVR